MQRILLVMGSGAALAACTNLAAVRDISSDLTMASESWDDVGAEFAGSCARERMLNPALADCALEERASAGLMAANAVLGQYFEALMAAADQSNFTIAPGLADAGAAVSGIPGIDPARVDAVSGLVGLLSGLATDGARERTLRDLIDKGGPAAQTLVEGMNDLVVPRLTRRLDTERLQLTGQFGRLILAEGDDAGRSPEALCRGSGAAGFSGAGFLLATEYCRRVAVLDERRGALSDYQASLAEASNALEALQSSDGKLKARDLAIRLYAIGDDLNRRVRNVRRAFG